MQEPGIGAVAVVAALLRLNNYKGQGTPEIDGPALPCSVHPGKWGEERI